MDEYMKALAKRVIEALETAAAQYGFTPEEFSLMGKRYNGKVEPDLTSAEARLYRRILEDAEDIRRGRTVYR